MSGRQVLVDAEALTRIVGGAENCADDRGRKFCAICGQPGSGHVDDCPVPALQAALTQTPAEPERALVTELEILRRGWERDAIVIYAQETVKEADGSTTWLDNECRTEHDTLRRCVAELAALTQPAPDDSHKVPQVEP